MRLLTLVFFLSSLLLLSGPVSAWPWPPSLEEFGLIFRRQNGGSSSTESNTASAAATTAAASTSASAAASTSITGSQGSSAAATTGQSGSASKTASSTSSISIPANAAAGGVEMTNPPAASTSYYKVGDYVTFAWNYTSLSVTPSAIDVLASCSENDATYTIALNQTVEPTGNQVVWDTGAYQSTATIPLLTETYTLIIYDAASSISATAKPGYLGVYDQFTFGMYISQPYTPLNSFQCATCSSALSDMERNTLGFMFTMGAITVLSFTWFVGGFGAML